MPYIGNDIQYGELTSETFTGDGSTVAFTMGYTVANTTSILVTSGNAVQEPTVAYTVAGTTLTFTSAPENGDTIHVRYLGRTLDVSQTAIVQDADQDTKIQVEESADEDTIRFDVAGAEVATFTSSGLTLIGTELSVPVTNSITAGSTQTQAGATALTTGTARVTVSGTDGDGVKLPTAVAGQRVLIINDDAAQTIKVWPNTSDAIGGGSANAVDANVLGPGLSREYVAVDATNWYDASVFISQAAATVLDDATVGDMRTTLGFADLLSQARAWIHFDGTGTISIVASFNVASISDSGTGDYRVNLSTAMADTSYVMVASAHKAGGSPSGSNSTIVMPGEVQTTTQFSVNVINADGSLTDSSSIFAVVFGAV